jgi:dCTP deaminase
VILSDEQILQEIREGNIVIRPFDRRCLGSNSYDVHLGPYLATYSRPELDVRRPNPIHRFRIPKEGFVLMPNQLYLGVTQEYTETLRHVPFLEGKSSVGRLGIDIHSTAGKGDVGYANYWTLEISAKVPVRIYSRMPIGQLIYFEVSGTVRHNYGQKSGAKYTRVTRYPVPSRMYLNFR